DSLSRTVALLPALVAIALSFWTVTPTGADPSFSTTAKPPLVAVTVLLATSASVPARLGLMMAVLPGLVAVAVLLVASRICAPVTVLVVELNMFGSFVVVAVLPLDKATKAYEPVPLAMALLSTELSTTASEYAPFATALPPVSPVALALARTPV